MKTILIIAAVAASLAGLHLVEDIPAPQPWEPGDSAARVRAFVRGERETVDEADLYAETVSPELRRAALNLAD